MLFDYDISAISGAILFIKTEYSLTSGVEEIVVSSVLLGSLVGAMVSSMLADRLGRRTLLFVLAIVFALGAIGAALAPGTTWLIAGRLVVGSAIGIASFVAPLYISEIAPVAIRGKLVSINQVALTIGIVIFYFDRLRLCRCSRVALDICHGIDSCRRVWHRTDLQRGAHPPIDRAADQAEATGGRGPRALVCLGLASGDLRG